MPHLPILIHVDDLWLGNNRKPLLSQIPLRILRPRRRHPRECIRAVPWKGYKAYIRASGKGGGEA